MVDSRNAKTERGDGEMNEVSSEQFTNMIIGLIIGLANYKLRPTPSVETGANLAQITMNELC